MASVDTFKRSNSNCRTALLCDDSRNATEISGIEGEISKEEASLGRDMEGLSVSKRLTKSVSEKLKKKKNGSGGYSNEESLKSQSSSSRCLNLYVKGGGCRVGACEVLEGSGKRLVSLEDCMPHRMVAGVEETGVQCFSYSMPERFWKKNVRKEKAVQQHPSSLASEVSLPDDVLEMILVRLPLASLMISRCVCKKWRDLTTTPQFIQFRSEGCHQSPWLFMFGITRDGYHTGEMHALDISLDRWHRISADRLKGRFLFSVAGIGADIYVVGGCSSVAHSTVSLEKGSFKTHKGVLVYSPLTGSWRKAASMKSARSRPVLGVFEVTASCNIFRTRSDKHNRLPLKSRLGGVSDVYEDPHRFSIRRRLRDAFVEDDQSSEFLTEQYKFVGEDVTKLPKLALIAVGGHGCLDEPLESGEIYDPLTNKWIEIAGLPLDFGAVCSGAVCSRMFYVYSETDKLAAYDLERGFWFAIQTSQPPPRLREYYPKFVSCQSRLFMLCVSWCERDGRTNRSERAVRKLFELDFALNKWAEVSRHPDAPMDWNPAFVVDQDRIYGLEMFKIFGQVLDFLTSCQVSDSELKWSRISRKHAAHEADPSSCRMKSMVVLNL
ncbi:F-box/kelch-repeat protein At5g42350-like [Typha angustifolia]|uniref:F-box/kelch-repeat protein At5g42350-like n=1 Tax=Typha angustifolia TaxID=59011 RepID=UPI003C305F59